MRQATVPDPHRCTCITRHVTSVIKYTETTRHYCVCYCYNVTQWFTCSNIRALERFQYRGLELTPQRLL